MYSYYRKFIRNFADNANLLTRLTQKNLEFVWDNGTETAFQQLKLILVRAPILSFLEDDGTVILDTDASGVAVGAVLSQKQGGVGKVAYYSQSFYHKQQAYCVTRRELLAVVKALTLGQS